MIKSIDIGELSQDLTSKKVSVFPCAVCSEKHKEVPTQSERIRKKKCVLKCMICAFFR